MKFAPMLICCLLIAGCQTAPVVVQAPEQLFDDALFSVPSERIRAEDVFAASPEMKRYLANDIGDLLRTKGPQRGLIEALYTAGQLKVDYDSAETRNAAQTFAGRAGNCLSLVIMTAALAKELGLQVQYQGVLVDEIWSRSGGIYFSVGHVNLTIGRRYHDIRTRIDDNAWLTIDFVPLGNTNGQRSWVIDEKNVIAMYMNNRAAEALARGQLNDAYWWTREAINQDPNFLSAYNTLGVVYRRHGNSNQAEAALRYALTREPENLPVMSNLATVLGDEGKISEARQLAAKVESKNPYPPYYFFNQGVAAMQAGDYQKARDLFSQDLARDAYNHEFHYWIAAAYARLGDMQQARRHLRTAMEFSNTRQERDIYAAKLDRLSAHN